MEQNNKNPIFIIYDTFKYKVFDYTQSKNVKIYASAGIEKLEDEDKLFEVNYQPIFEETEHKNLLDFYDNSPVFINLYNKISFIYCTIYVNCHKWYNENSKVINAFNLNEQISKYEKKVKDEYCCPIIKDLNLNNLDNINVIGNLKSLMSDSAVRKIDSIDILFYGENVRINSPRTHLGNLLLNSIDNVVYLRFLSFLKSKQEKNEQFLPQKTELKTEQDNKPTVAAYAIMHVYLFMFKGQPITQQNKNELAKKYGYNNGDQLRNDFTKFRDENKRLDLSTTNKLSANTHIQRLRTILPILQKVNLQAFQKASDDLGKLENEYKKHY